MDKLLNKAGEVAKIVVNKSLNNGYDIHLFKLEQLLALMQAEHLANFGKPIFPEEVRTFGDFCFIPTVDNDFRGFDISYETDTQNECPLTRIFDGYISLLESEELVVDDVLRRYGKASSLTILDDPFFKYVSQKNQGNDELNRLSQKELSEAFKMTNSRNCGLAESQESKVQ